MAGTKKTNDLDAGAGFFRYVDENGRRVTIAGAAIVEVIENPQHGTVNVNFGDGAPDEFEGEVADKFLKFWAAYTS